MNAENMQINVLANHPVMSLIGICTAYQLQNKHKYALFSSLNIKQQRCVDIIIKLLAKQNPSFDDLMKKVLFHLKRFGKINSDIHQIILEMNDLAAAFKCKNEHGSDEKMSVDLQSAFQVWVDTELSNLTDEQSYIVDYITDILHDAHSGYDFESISESIISNLGSMCVDKHETRQFIAHALEKIENLQSVDCQSESVSTWQEAFANWLSVQHINAPYSGDSYKDYLTREELGSMAEPEAILDRLSNLKAIIE